ncbi:MAG: hypothetical protein COW88_01615 [Candidatus Lloydbacteria bacterium CG22_combo_CG10-13_8_21_14_all_47_15]|uniref:Uncharacterized protein n=1 Tax=Candidatus Lloydbacteria bacterium CG22_combo_CG10-13_8_21_14_all_47_15 TaxID=1974635 RepID=A0A2H0CVV2_9BACT|nr:MAG: hypothetical protein COW88_01615 [Candidatus Lloydbacteria bacterium CG22_combo_CG10-13_8_21_14_all_47_15]
MAPFGKSRANVSKQEFHKKVRSALATKSFSLRERDKIESMLVGDIHETGIRKGLDKNEIDNRIDWMKKNKRMHGLSDTKIDTLKKELYKHL